MDYVIFVIPLAVLAGYLLGGSLKNLEQARIRGLWIIFVSFLLRLTANIPDAFENGPLAWLNSYLNIVNLISFFLLAAFCLLNINYRSFKLFFIGTLLNLIPIIGSKGRMPYEVSQAEKYGVIRTIKTLEQLGAPYAPSNHSAPFWWLGDWIAAPGLRSYKLISIGDILIVVAIFFVIIELMKSD